MLSLRFVLSRVLLFLYSLGPWCSFRSLRNLSMHLGLGLIGFFLPTFIVDISCNAALCDICGDWLDRCSSREHFVNLIRSFLILRLIHLNAVTNPYINGVHPLTFCSL